VFLASRRPPVATGLIDGKRNTAIKFTVRGHLVTAPSLSAPFLPVIAGDGGVMRSAVTPVVHEICALNMFKSRMDKGRHAFRRRRRAAAERLIRMTGLTVQPLGFDDAGREYWKLPTSEDLFVCCISYDTSEREELQALIKGKKFSPDITTPIFPVKPQWKRVSDPIAIRHIIELLGRSLPETKLKLALTSNFTLDAKIEDIKPVAEVLEEVVSGDVVRHTEIAEAVEGSDPSVPHDLFLIVNGKNMGISRNVLIEEEEAFEENAAGDVDEDEQEEADNHKEYFSYNRKHMYYAVVVRNTEGKALKLPKGSLTVNYQIHRDSMGLTYTPLDQQWSDNIYYFSTVDFKRSGNYTISFIAEGKNASALKPLVFPITVRARRINFGAESALRRLNASNFLAEARDREVAYGKRYHKDIIDKIGPDYLQSTKCALLTLYYALPTGSLSLASATSVDIFSAIAEAEGWSENLDQIWQGKVANATSASTLMECVLLLEYYIDKHWFDSSLARLVGALPNHQFAMRCCSYASVCLRIYVLDRALTYSLAQAPSRVRREKSKLVNTPIAMSSYVEEDDEEDGGGRSKRQRKPVVRLHENADNGEDDEDGRLKRGRTSRGADELEASQRGPSNWDCGSCSMTNEARSRSCSVCGEKKSSIFISSKQSSHIKTKNNHTERASYRSKSKVSYADDDDDDDEEDEDEDDEEDEEEEEEEENDAVSYY
jgi:hypothetical protein